MITSKSHCLNRCALCASSILAAAGAGPAVRRRQACRRIFWLLAARVPRAAFATGAAAARWINQLLLPREQEQLERPTEARAGRLALISGLQADCRMKLLSPPIKIQRKITFFTSRGRKKSPAAPLKTPRFYGGRRCAAKIGYPG